jgi:hypothetical protein
MKLVFVKGAGKFDRLDVIRPDGQIESINCPKQRIIPHDMVHYAVESTLDKRGFIRRVSDGELATFQMVPESESDSVERLVEVFQGDGWSGSGSSAADMIDMYRVTCMARTCPMLPIQASDVEAVRDRIAELTLQWGNIAAGESLILAL